MADTSPKPDPSPAQTEETKKGVAAGLLGGLGCGFASLAPITFVLLAVLAVLFFGLFRGCS